MVWAGRVTQRLIHGYDTIDLEIVWPIITRDLPGLVRELDRMGLPGGEECGPA